MNVALACLEDLDELAVLFDAYRVFYKNQSDLAGAQQFLRARIESAESVIYIARNAQNLALGFTQLYPIFSSQSMQRSWLLNDLYVAEPFRRQGVAEALLTAAEDLSKSKGAKGLMLCTQHSNSNAQALYEKFGFKPLDDFKWYFLATPGA